MAASLGPPAVAGDGEASHFTDLDVVVLATPDGHPKLAERAVVDGTRVVSVADSLSEVRGLLALDAKARKYGRTVVVGAGFAPGLTCLLARHAAAELDAVDEVHVAKAGTGGPACVRQRRQALSAPALDWRQGAWVPTRGWSGRELCWFPDPVGPRDCYRAGLPEALVLVPAFSGVGRVTSRLAASRGERLTRRLPVAGPRAHREDVVGAVRVEVRGRQASGREVRVLGAVDRPAVAAGTVAGLAAAWAARDALAGPGAGGLATLVVEPLPFLTELAHLGVRAAAFEGSA